MNNHKNSGGNIMSLKTRIGLMASSSLAAASISAATSLVVTLTPAAATAQTAPGVCSPDPATVAASGPGADIVTCLAQQFTITPPAPAAPIPAYPAGIAYSSNGDLSVTIVANGTTTNTNVGPGVDLIGNGADNVSWNSSIGAVIGGVGPGPVLDVTTNSGSISITTGLSVNGNQAGRTHGIRAASTGGGDISITRNGGVNNNVAGGQAAMEAVTAGGDIAITGVSGGFTQGRLRGILAQTSGAGTINISVAQNTTASTIDGIAAIDTIAGTGATTISIAAGTVDGGAGVAIRSVSSGTVTIQQNAAAFSTVAGRLNFSGVAGGVTWNGGSQGFWQASGNSSFSAGADTVSVGGTLAAGGLIDFGSGSDTFNVPGGNGSFTLTSGTINFGAGADQLNVNGRLEANGATINFGADADSLVIAGILNANNAMIDFGAGADQLDQEATVFSSGLTTIANLEAFNNSGDIYLGAGGFGDSTDGNANDRLVLNGGVFTGSGESRIHLDAFLGDHDSQLGCAAAVTADCVDFTGATTAGSTRLVVQDASFSLNAGTLGAVVTLIEGSTAADHFTLDPASTFYTETSVGPALRKPVVAYYFQYDAANQRHILVAAPTEEPFQVGTFATAAQETWRATAGSWLTRQADLRSTPGGLEASRGIWGKISGQSGEREATATSTTGGVALDFDLAQKQRIAHLNFGADLVSGPGWVVGGAVGFVRSDVEFEATPTEATLTGFSGGLYASYGAGPLFIDALLNGNNLHVKADAPQMGLGDEVPMKFDLKSVGGQAEAGWRIPAGAFFVEPLAGVSYVLTMINDAEVPGGAGLFEFEQSESLRLGGGARLGMESQLMGMAASYSLTGRVWNEFEGLSSATITTASGSSAALVDELTGDFSEVIASLNLFSGAGGLSGFANLGGKFGQDYQAVDGSVGVRVRW